MDTEPCGLVNQLCLLVGEFGVQQVVIELWRQLLQQQRQRQAAAPVIVMQGIAAPGQTDAGAQTWPQGVTPALQINLGWLQIGIVTGQFAQLQIQRRRQAQQGQMVVIGVVCQRVHDPIHPVQPQQ